MKKAYLLLLMPLLIAACQTKTASTAGTDSTAAPKYPYTIKNPDYWVMDTSHTNTMSALSALKAFEKMDTATLKKSFADTLEFNYDGGKFKGSPSQFMKETVAMMATMKNVTIDMKDWEAVVSKDKKEEWVTLWYTQHWTDAKGKADSVMLINDMMFKAGKIAKLNEYDMHAAPVKK